MNFYEITTHAGRFWIQAERASAAYRQAHRLVPSGEFKLERCNDLQFTDTSQEG